MFSILVASQITALFMGISFLAPATWANQCAAGIGPFILTFLGAHLFVCFFEWPFHRYVLHATVHPWLAYFSRSHRNHHALTAITLRPNMAGPGKIVLNEYPIMKEEQYEDAVFPPYALLAFWTLFTPLLILTQQLLPRAPVFLGGYLAIAWSMFTYEVFHSIEHYSYEWWKTATDHPRFGWFWKKVYGFHHFHHANIGANEAISGFFGLPVADWFFRTYNQPQELLLNNRIATAKEFQVKQPWPFVVWLDRWARQRETTISYQKRNK